MNASGNVRRLIYAAVFLALALVLPFITGQIPEIGKKLSPMHIPVLLCGFICGWPWGLAVGFIAPLLRSLLFGMPVMIPGAAAMAFELAVYGGVSGILHRILPDKKWIVYIELIIAMIAGRIVWGIARAVLAGMTQFGFTWALFLADGFINAVPAVILQLILIPVLVTAMERAGLSLNRKERRKQA